MERGDKCLTFWLSKYMCQSWETDRFWLDYAACKSWAFDTIFWMYLDERFFGSRVDPTVTELNLWTTRADLLTKEERDAMELSVA